jgi:hypothetical protein
MIYFLFTIFVFADPSGRAAKGLDLWPLACQDCGFESCQRHECLSLLRVVFCQVDISASGWPLVQRSPTECGVSECDRATLTMRKPCVIPSLHGIIVTPCTTLQGVRVRAVHGAGSAATTYEFLLSLLVLS